MGCEVFYSKDIDGKIYNFYLDSNADLKVTQVGLGEIRARGMIRYDKALPDLKDRIIEVLTDSQLSVIDGELKIEVGYKGRQNVGPRDEFAYIYLNNPSFTDLNFYFAPLTAESEVLALRQSLNGNTNLEGLDFQNCETNGVDPQILRELFKAAVHLEKVNLAGQHLDDDQIEGAVRGLLHNRCIKHLDLGINNFDELGMTAVEKLLKSSTTIEKLNLYMRSFSTSAVSALARGLRKNKSLRYLNLDESGIGPKGGKILAKALEENQNLTSINLSDTRVGTEGSKALGQMLKVNTSLTSLDLSFNNLDDDAIVALAEGLSANKALQILSLDNNKIGSRGINAIVSAFSAGSAIEYISLRHNEVSDEDALKVAKMFERCFYLKNLRLKDDSIKDWGAVVCQAQQSRQHLADSWNSYKRFVRDLLTSHKKESSNIHVLAPDLVEMVMFSAAYQFGFTAEFVKMVLKNPTFTFSDVSIVDYSDNKFDSE